MNLCEWNSSEFTETVIKGIDAKRCTEVIAKLAWLDTQQKPLISASEEPEKIRRTVSGFHNRLTSSQHR